VDDAYFNLDSTDKELFKQILLNPTIFKFLAFLVKEASSDLTELDALHTPPEKFQLAYLSLKTKRDVLEGLLNFLQEKRAEEESKRLTE